MVHLANETFSSIEEAVDFWNMMTPADRRHSDELCWDACKKQAFIQLWDDNGPRNICLDDDLKAIIWK